MKIKKVLVYGSGVSGLIVAYKFFKKGFLVTVVDPYNEPILQTIQTEQGPVELAANSILYNASVKELLDDIKLDYFFYNEHGKRKYFCDGESVSRWPLSVLETLSVTGFVFKNVFAKNKLQPQKNQTLKQWASRHLSISLYEQVFKLGLQGIYGPGVDSLSASLVLNNFLNNKKKKTKLRGSVSFKRGMSELTDSLKKYLERNDVSFVKTVEDTEDCLKVVSTPAHSLPDFVLEENKKVLEKINYKKISTATLFFNEEDRLPFKGFGCVFSKPKGVLGLILNSDIFENRAKKGFVSETWILNGNVFTDKDKSVSFVSDFRKSLTKSGTSKPPKFSYFKYWDKAFPAYDLALEQSLSKIKPQKNVYYFANWTGQLGIGRLIESSEDFVEKIKKSNKE